MKLCYWCLALIPAEQNYGTANYKCLGFIWAGLLFCSVDKQASIHKAQIGWGATTRFIYIIVAREKVAREINSVQKVLPPTH